MTVHYIDTPEDDDVMMLIHWYVSIIFGGQDDDGDDMTMIIALMMKNQNFNTDSAFELLPTVCSYAKWKPPPSLLDQNGDHCSHRNPCSYAKWRHCHPFWTKNIMVFSYIVLKDIMAIGVLIYCSQRYHGHHCSYAKQNSEAPRNHPFTLDSHCHNHHHQFLLVAFSELCLSATDLTDVDAHLVRWDKILRHGL